MWEPQGSRVRRVKGMPGRVTMWVDHVKSVVYIDAEEITECKARLTEAALRKGAVTLNDLTAAYTRSRSGVRLPHVIGVPRTIWPER